MMLEKLSEYFDTCERAELWIYTNNPNFGYKSPIAMYDMGRGDFVLNFIDDALEENRLV